MEGWIKLHRKLKKHWLWKDAEKLRWWLDLLIEANHEERKVPIKGEVITCKKGQTVRSEVSWALDWNVDRGMVRRFFKMLADDGMITIFPHNKTTIITICNYDTYQQERTGKRTVNEHQTHNGRTSNAHKQELQELQKGGEGGAATPPPAEYSESQKEEFSKFQNWIASETPQVSKMAEPFTIEQYFKITAQYGKVGYMLKQMHNKKDLVKKYLSAYHTCANWMRREKEAV